MDYQKSSSIGGKWAKGSELVGCSSAKIMTVTKPHPSAFLNKDGSVKNQDVCKVSFEGKDSLNVNLNRPTLNALIEAFGTDSNKWIGKELGVETEKVKVAGKTVTAFYLVPEGFKRMDDAEGYTIIVRDLEGVQPEAVDDIPVIDVDEDEIKISDIPF